MVLSVGLAERTRCVPAAAAGMAAGGDVMPPVAQEAVLDALDRGETHYTDRPGILPLRQKVAAALGRRFGLSVNAKADVVITCGVTEARFVCLQELAGVGDTVFAAAMPERIAGAAVIRGATLAATPDGAKLAFLPASLGESLLRAALASLGPDTIVVFETDDAGGSFHPSAVAGFAERTVTIGDLLAGEGLASARIGYLAAPSTRAPALRDFKQALTICTTNLSQWAALAAMETP